MFLLHYITSRLSRPGRNWVDEEAYLAGYAAKLNAENPFSDFKARLAWREGHNFAHRWK